MSSSNWVVVGVGGGKRAYPVLLALVLRRIRILRRIGGADVDLPAVWPKGEKDR